MVKFHFPGKRSVKTLEKIGSVSQKSTCHDMVSHAACSSSTILVSKSCIPAKKTHVLESP